MQDKNTSNEGARNLWEEKRGGKREDVKRQRGLTTGTCRLLRLHIGTDAGAGAGEDEDTVQTTDRN
uniref:WGS project CBMG000000000 data, contig CS5907-c001433 n=1 Tax=Fusarium acuminatum CS5907 TaxID=1318461 RepID=A0A096PET1_9HYPO|nr:unnamed protein product [Fusarium acuminatum CS5907]